MKRTSDAKSESLSSHDGGTASSALFSGEAGSGRRRGRKRKGGGRGRGERDKKDQSQQAVLNLATKEKKTERKSFFPTVPILRLMTQIEVLNVCRVCFIICWTLSLSLPLSLILQHYKSELREYLVSLCVHIQVLSIYNACMYIKPQ